MGNESIQPGEAREKRERKRERERREEPRIHSIHLPGASEASTNCKDSRLHRLTELRLCKSGAYLVVRTELSGSYL